jgi:hypothetical protein
VSPPRQFSDEQAADIAIAMTAFEREVIKLCSKEKSSRYTGIAKKINAEYEDVQAVGHKLQEMRLAYVVVIPYNGSAIFLNDRGETVKLAVLALERVRYRRNT